jgi:hypothetical protein
MWVTECHSSSEYLIFCEVYCDQFNTPFKHYSRSAGFRDSWNCHALIECSMQSIAETSWITSWRMQSWVWKIEIQGGGWFLEIYRMSSSGVNMLSFEMLQILVSSLIMTSNQQKEILLWTWYAGVLHNSVSQDISEHFWGYRHTDEPAVSRLPIGTDINRVW